MSVLIVGASIAGVRTAQALRQAAYAGPITLLGEEPHHPYDKPPLSKEMLGADGDTRPRALLGVDDLAALDVELRLGTRAVGLDTGRRYVRTDGDREVGYRHLVIATGATPRSLPGTDGIAGVRTLRRAEDAVALRARMAPGRRAVVIGAGFVGAEFAAAARAHDMHVTLVEAQPTPLSHVLGDAVGAELAGLHRLYGAELHTAVRVDHVACDGRGEVRAVVLADGRELPADLVVVGIGAVPATAWLEGSGLPADDGVVCDERLRVVGHDGIHAAGDVARWPHPWYGPVRIEHWTNAQEHASVVAADICGLTQPAPTAPYVWSDQCGRRIQIVGRPSSAESVTVDGSVLAGRMVALYAGADGVLVGAVVVDDPRLLLQCRRALTRGRQAEELRDEVLVAR